MEKGWGLYANNKIIVRKKIIKNKYTASLKIFGKITSSVGATLSEALASLAPQGKVMGRSILTISSGLVSKDRVLNPAQTFRLFSPNKMTREIALKNIALLFNI